MIKSKSFLNTLLVTLFISLPLLWPSVQAQTPDGETPANEGVCNSLIGFTPGLYGLCVAFCEAQDAEATFDPEAEDGVVTFAVGSRPSNPKLLEIYNKKKADGDPDMPCVRAQCPCWNVAELDRVGGNYPLDICRTDAAMMTIVNIQGFDFTEAFEFAEMIRSTSTCSYQAVDDSNPSMLIKRLMQPVNSAQGDLCFQDVEAECASRDVELTTP